MIFAKKVVLYNWLNNFLFSRKEEDFGIRLVLAFDELPSSDARIVVEICGSIKELLFFDEFAFEIKSYQESRNVEPQRLCDPAFPVASSD